MCNRRGGDDIKNFKKIYDIIVSIKVNGFYYIVGALVVLLEGKEKHTTTRK